MTGDVDCVWSAAATLGEGPMWDGAALWFVDIKEGRIHRFDPATGDRQTHDIGGRPSFVVRGENAMIVGDGLRIARFTPGAPLETLAEIAMPAGNRTNDATVDPEGRLWFGTMDDGEAAPTGRVYRYDGAMREMGGACTITNGPAVSTDGRWLYHVDTLARVIWRFDISGDPARLGEGERFVEIAAEDGNPDGVTVDSQGCVWVGLWGGWSLRRYSPTGEMLVSVALPCANVTKVAFGGPDMTTGLVTTARAGLSADDLAKQPLAGGLFAFAAPAPGLSANIVR